MQFLQNRKVRSKKIAIILIVFTTIAIYWLYAVMQNLSNRIAFTPTFIEVAYQSGIDFTSEYIDYGVTSSMAGGVAIGDIDNNGWDDIYFTNLNHDKLYLNQGDFKFIDSSLQWHVPYNQAGTGSLLADVNNDGWLDLFVYNLKSQNKLYLNKQTYFEAAPSQSELNTLSSSYGAAMADIDRDGDLDLYIANYGDMDYYLSIHGEYGNPLQQGIDSHDGDTDFLFINDTTGHFTITENIINDQNRWGLGAAFADLNNDGWQDLYIANDFGQDQLYINYEGTLTEVTDVFIPNETRHGMNVAYADYNADGYLDVFVTNITDHDIYEDDGNFLWRNNEGSKMENVAMKQGVKNGGWGWSGVFGDYDNDSDIDLFQVNAYDDGFGDMTPEHMSHLFLNNGENFYDGAYESGVQEQRNGRGAAVADFDRDGFLDLVVNNHGNSPSLFRNQGNDNNWIGFDLQSNLMPSAGARISLSVDDTKLIREIGVGSNYLSQNSSLIHFGIGDTTSIDTITITWPDGTMQELFKLSINRYHQIQKK